MRIVMVGAGYVGLVSGVCFSDFGHDVICVDKDSQKIDRLIAGKSPIYEPGLTRLMEKNIAEKQLHFSTDLAGSVAEADAIFIAVGTPEYRGDGYADLEYVFEAAKEIAHALRQHSIIITKSTVPVGTNKKIKEIILAEVPHADFDIASNPEFLREGEAIEDFMRPDRIIVGAESESARQTMAEIYRPITARNFPIVMMDIESAELTKYAANAFLATKITFINEIAALCEKVGADIVQVSKGMGLDARIGARFLNAGPGYGGSCFPKDTKALAKTAVDKNYPLRITQTVIEVNESIKQRMIEKIIVACGGKLDGKRIAVLGCTFKPGTDDMRAAPSLTILPALIKQKAQICITDPQGERGGRAQIEGAEWASDAYSCVEDADCVILLTEWNQFRALDLVRLAAHMRDPVMIDLQNIYEKDAVIAAGFHAYTGIGTPSFP